MHTDSKFDYRWKSNFDVNGRQCMFKFVFAIVYSNVWCWIRGLNYKLNPNSFWSINKNKSTFDLQTPEVVFSSRYSKKPSYGFQFALRFKSALPNAFLIYEYRSTFELQARGSILQGASQAHHTGREGLPRGPILQHGKPKTLWFVKLARTRVHHEI